ncbi:hypothetical protein JL722_4673 [Aureococcus anophagefferens]|nr:hypothetical protein JL722_4673 [Aureococcus anophagefferens]
MYSIGCPKRRRRASEVALDLDHGHLVDELLRVAPGARSAADAAHVAWKHGSVAALAAEEIGAWELASGAAHGPRRRPGARRRHHSIAALAAEAAAARRREALEPPSTDEIPAFYDDGSGAPIVEGLDRCAAFRAATTDARRPAVAGLFNTGTNFLMKLLRSNCVLPRECEDRSHPGFDRGGKRARTSRLHRLPSRPFSTRFDKASFLSEANIVSELHYAKRRQGKCAPFLMQVPWGKHNPLEWRGSHYADYFEGVDVDEVLPVVVVKDPLTWMRSMCRMEYAAKFRHGQAQCCPHPVMKTATDVRFRRERPAFNYTSLPDFWSKWNDARPSGGAGHGFHETGRNSATAKYGNETKRYEFLTDADVTYVADHADPRFMAQFHYGVSRRRREPGRQGRGRGAAASRAQARAAKAEDHVAWRRGSVRAVAAERVGAWETEGAFPPFYDDGSGAPVVDGLERCAAFRERTSDARRPGLAGLFNTGTNLMMLLLRANCELPRECPGAPRRLVAQGKHNIIDAYANHTAKMYAARSYREARAADPLENVLGPGGRREILPVVVVKDPLTWMKSMCRMPYAASFRRGHAQCCPSPVAKTKTTVNFQQKGFPPSVFSSLPDFWSRWNRLYYDAEFPRLMVRYEDLLWRGEATTRRVCECVGGAMRATFDPIDQAAKSGFSHGTGAVSGRADARSKYANESRRYEFLDDADLAAYEASRGLKRDAARNKLVPLDDESDGVIVNNRFYPNLSHEDEHRAAGLVRDKTKGYWKPKEFARDGIEVNGKLYKSTGPVAGGARQAAKLEAVPVAKPEDDDDRWRRDPVEVARARRSVGDAEGRRPPARPAGDGARDLVPAPADRAETRALGLRAARKRGR